MPTYEEALVHLGIDYPDENIKTIVTQKLAAAVSTVKGAVGDDVELLLPDDSRVKELVLAYLADLYDNRGVSAKISNAVRLSMASMELQVKMELRQIREEAAT